jgi:hypothetical protein
MTAIPHTYTASINPRYHGKITVEDRRRLRAEIAARNVNFRTMHKTIRIGRFIRLERTHAWGIQAVFQMVRA